MPQSPAYFKCSCQNCGGHIEFPAEAVGQTVTCPHCQWDTVLVGAKVGKARPSIILSLVLGVAVLAGGAWAVLHFRPPTAPEVVVSPPPAPTNIPVKPKPKPKPAPDPWHGLHAGPVKLEKAGNGSLVYAVGDVHNDSKRQRFGVKVELDVFDADNKKVGTATDYASVIEPGKDWHFRALLTDRTAASAKLTQIHEQE
jgi:hypothetical protein